MKTLAALILILFAMFITGHAQACGAFYISVTVQHADGTPINNANVAMRPGTTDETQGKKFERDKQDPSKFVIQYSEGTVFKTPQLVSVTAPGYYTAEIPAIFTSCENLAAVVKLSRKGLPAHAVWEFKVNVNAEADGEDERFIHGAKLTVVDAAGRSEDVEGFDKGYAFFDLPNGKYLFKFSAPGYESKEESVDLTTFGRKVVIEKLKKQ